METTGRSHTPELVIANEIEFSNSAASVQGYHRDFKNDQRFSFDSFQKAQAFYEGLTIFYQSFGYRVSEYRHDAGQGEYRSCTVMTQRFKLIASWTLCGFTDMREKELAGDLAGMVEGMI